MNDELTYPRGLNAASELTHTLRAALPRLRDRTCNQLDDLYRDTTGVRAFIAAQAVAELYAHLVRLGAELDRRR